MTDQLSDHLATILRKMDGLSYRANSANIPHPVDLGRLKGLYAIDSANDRFVLTDAGRKALADAA